MKMMKMVKIIVISVALLLFCTSCGKANETERYLNTWYEEANLEGGNETKEALYEKALEEDTLVIYSTTTRIYDVKDSFEKEYPGLTVEVYDTRAHDLLETLERNYEQNSFPYDIIICSDDNAKLSADMLSKKVVNRYVPADIKPVMYDDAMLPLLSFVRETEQLFYNSQTYPECPIENWWEMTTPEWTDKIYMNSPLHSFPAYALVHAVIANSDEMEQAYELYFGEPMTIPEGRNAGMVFWEMLVANGLQFTTSSNDLVEIVGAPNQTDPPLAFMISSKIRRQAIGLQVAAAYGLAPCDGVYSENTISIAGGAKNVNAAKLFIRWVLGETDGTGEGVAPYVLEGTWPVRQDIENPSSVALTNENFWFNDKQEVDEMEEEILRFWEGLLQEPS